MPRAMCLTHEWSKRITTNQLTNGCPTVCNPVPGHDRAVPWLFGAALGLRKVKDHALDFFEVRKKKTLGLLVPRRELVEKNEKLACILSLLVPAASDPVLPSGREDCNAPRFSFWSLIS